MTNTEDLFKLFDTEESVVKIDTGKIAIAVAKCLFEQIQADAKDGPSHFMVLDAEEVATVIGKMVMLVVFNIRAMYQSTVAEPLPAEKLVDVQNSILRDVMLGLHYGSEMELPNE